jgi:hypothetical protein
MNHYEAWRAHHRQEKVRYVIPSTLQGLVDTNLVGTIHGLNAEGTAHTAHIVWDDGSDGYVTVDCLELASKALPVTPTCVNLAVRQPRKMRI